MSRTQGGRPPSPAPKKKSPPYLWIALGAMGVVALVTAVVLSGGDSKDPGMPSSATVAIAGDRLPIFTGNPNADPAVGMAAPTLAGEDFTGSAVSIADDGRPKVILFLAHWCPHCQREVPVVQAFEDAVGFPRDIDFYSVATSYSSSQPNWPPSAWLAREGWTFPVVVDDPQSGALLAFGHGAFPYYVFLDAEGNVAMRLSGEQEPEVLVSLMERLVDS